MRDRCPRRDCFERLGRGDSRHHADRQRNTPRRIAAAKRVAHRIQRCRFGCRREQGKPQRPIDRIGSKITSAGFCRAAGKGLRGDIGIGISGDAVKVLQIGNQRCQLGAFGVARTALQVGLAFDRQDIELAIQFKPHRLHDRVALGQHGQPGLRLVIDRNLHQPARRTCRAERLAKQAQEGEPLALGDQVGTIKYGIAHPGEQIDQRASRITFAQVGPFRRMRRNAAQHIGNQIGKTAIVKRWRSDRHQAPPIGTESVIAAATPIWRMR